MKNIQKQTPAAPSTRVPVRRHKKEFVPDSSRVLIRPFIQAQPHRLKNIIERVLSLEEEVVERLLAEVLADFGDRHFRVDKVFDAHYAKVVHHVPKGRKLSRQRQLLLGSYCTSEYALESAALFNPSIVPHPDQSGLSQGSTRFVMSLRATGEGHISSIEFRTGIIDRDDNIEIDPVGQYVVEPEIIRDPAYDKNLFRLKIQEMGVANQMAEDVLGPLPDTFSLSQVEQALSATQKKLKKPTKDQQLAFQSIRWLTESNYEVEFDSQHAISDRIIFPYSANERNGIEDARFVRFTDDDGAVTYFATYTAYNGSVILPQLLETRDFMKFHIRTLNGKGVQNKGMALFPRKVNGRYVMISRQDNENLFIMTSDHPHFWNDYQQLRVPVYPWEFIQIGNCGSPIETERGWLLLTHGVGPVRKYCIGAILLDLEDPSKVIAHLPEPLLKPDENEREGYVPNVVYTCGAMLHNDTVVIPYAMSDYASNIASVSLPKLLDMME